MRLLECEKCLVDRRACISESRPLVFVLDGVFNKERGSD